MFQRKMEKLDSASSPGRQPQINFVFKSLGSWNKLSGFGPHLACRRVLFGLVERLGKNFKNELVANIHKSGDFASKFGFLASPESLSTLGVRSSYM